MIHQPGLMVNIRNNQCPSHVSPPRRYNADCKESRMIYRLFILLVLAISLGAAPFTRIVAFGDSLTDNGNLYASEAYPPSPPYFEGRGTNGPVAVEYLSAALGVPLLDFAVYGAT